MNTKSLKYMGIALTFGVLLALSAYFMSGRIPGRTVAENAPEQEHMTPGQKLKWSAAEQFSIQQTNESLIVDIPHMVDLCAENHFLNFKFLAYETTIAGENPNIQFMISCQMALSESKYRYEILFSDLISLHELKEKKLSSGILKSALIYTDEQFPKRWNLSEISVIGTGAFQINQFEINKVFGHNFEFELVK